MPLGSETNNKSAMLSTSILFISSGIFLSLDLFPDSTCANLMPYLLETNAPAKVELTSPNTTIKSI
jgi:hypothetical protein